SESLDAQRDGNRRLAQHADGLEQSVRAMRASWSWRLTAPVRFLTRPFAAPISWNLEQRLYRAYYAVPGISAARKRRFILWLHQRASWLTRRTMSYQINQEAERLQFRRSAASSPAPLRMDAVGAAEVVARLRTTPVISIVMPVYNVERR